MHRTIRTLLAAAVLLAASAGAPAQASAGSAPRLDAVLVGGDNIVLNGQRCVIGFNARSATTGARYIVTSGYCAGGSGLTAPVRAPDGSTSTPYVRGPGGSLLTVSPVLGRAPVGSSICMSGPVGGFRCGTVVAMNQTIRFADGTTVTGLTRTSVCAQAGEIGSPFVWLSGGRVIAQGTLLVGTGSCASFFQPINEVLSAYGLVLYTG